LASLGVEKYNPQELFENMLEGYAFCKIITNENNIPVDFLYLEINDAFERLTGLKKEETVGRRVTEIIPGIQGSKPNLFEIYGKVALTGENTKFEIFFEPLKIWLSLSVYSPKKNYFIAVFNNITECKKTEQRFRVCESNLRRLNNVLEQLIEERIRRLKESEEKYSDLFQYSNDAIILHDFEGNILEVNDRASELFNYSKEEFLTISTPMLRTIEEQEKGEAVSEDFSKKGFLKFEINFIKKNGTIFPAEVSSREIEIKANNVIQAVIRDISERKMVEQKLIEVNKLKSEFLRRASHELKIPLISIKGFSDLILTLYREELNPDIISKLGEINQGCERLQLIINDLIHNSKLESSEFKPKFEREDLTFLINYCVDELSVMSTKREHSLNIELPNSLIARFEKEEIHDVITNLLSNAIKYTPPKGCIDIKTETLEDFVVVSIRDNGIGFTEEEKDRIFQQFGKIKRSGQGLDLENDGTGLGLYISKKIVESHGGKIWMESEGKNKGSTFYFSLPK